MAVSEKMNQFIEKSSWIRKMFEEGGRLKKIHGEDKVFDFSLGNPNVPPPEIVREKLIDLVKSDEPGMHAYMPNAGFFQPDRPFPPIFAGSSASLWHTSR